MKAVILAAGRGSRLHPLTLKTPKPLLEIGKGRTLLGDLLANIKAVGIRQVIINTHRLGEMVHQYVDRYVDGMDVMWSDEAVLLETGGTLRQALPWLTKDEPCLVLAADIWTDYPLKKLLTRPFAEAGAHLVLVPNPTFHPQGDFDFHPEKPGLLQRRDQTGFTYSGYALMHPSLIASKAPGIFPMSDFLDLALHAGTLTGEVWHGRWFNVGTAQVLETLRAEIESSQPVQ